MYSSLPLDYFTPLDSKEIPFETLSKFNEKDD